MHAYVDQEDFKGLRIDDALRALLADFRLPGEAQKIDRIMEKFAERYCKDNPGKDWYEPGYRFHSHFSGTHICGCHEGTFRTADAAYLLSFAIIMLNTDAHNPMVDNKMSREDFVLMNAASGGGDSADAAVHEGNGGEALVLPVEELHGIYDRIQVERSSTKLACVRFFVV